MSKSNLVIIDNSIQDYSVIIDALQTDTKYILLDCNTDTYDTLKIKISDLAISGFSSVGIIQHNMGGGTYSLFRNGDADPATKSTLANVIESDPNLDSWSDYSNFITYFKDEYSMENFDLMACALYSDANWKYVIDTLETRTGVNIRASKDDTGSANLGGNWFLETDSVNLKDVYFTDAIDGFKGVLATGPHTVVIGTDNTIYATGNNGYGQLGDGTTTNRSTLTAMTTTNWSGKTPKSISCGTDHTVVLMTDGTIYGTGNNNYGQLGNGTTNQSTSLTTMTTTNWSGKIPRSISCALSHTVVLMTDGTIYATGQNSYGQLGVGDTTQRTTLTAMSIPSGKTPKSVSCGEVHTVVLMTDGSIYATGINGHGQFGNGTTTQSTSLTAMTMISGKLPKSVSCGTYHTVVLMTDGSIYSTGNNGYGQFGNDTYTGSTSLTAMTMIAGKIPKSVSCGRIHTVVLMTDGTIYATGYNGIGQLGDGTTTQRNSLTAMTTTNLLGKTPKSVFCGGNHTIVLMTDGIIYATGRNENGELGTGDTTNRTTLTAISGSYRQLADTEPEVSSSPPVAGLYAFEGHTFTNASATGRTGPTLSAVRSAYSTMSWATDTTNNYVNMTTQGIQEWKVPATGSYTIRAVGAGVPYDGYTSNGMNLYQKGMDATITTTLTKGEVIKILVGQMSTPGSNNGRGGGGGSFIVRGTQTPIIVAGGGGGRGNNMSDISSNATTSISGQTGSGYPGSNAGGAGGDANGSEGITTTYGGGGGGLIGNGTNIMAGLSFINGGSGGNNIPSGNNAGSNGGFGGGGGNYSGIAGGGGGGYSGGGGGGHLDGWSSGGGGGSYSITGSFAFANANNNSNGFVTIIPNFTITGPAVEGLYLFEGHTFTNASATGRFGPTLSAVRSAYSSASWAQDTTNNYLNMTNNSGIQLWKVPATGNYTIQAAGAAGAYSSVRGGRGLDISTTTTFTQGDVIKILVGQKGIAYTSSGGGGGTFVVRDSQTPILVAGGGGGAMNSSTFDSYTISNSDASPNNDGQDSWDYADVIKAGGKSGNGGDRGAWAAGGAGLLGDGTDGSGGEKGFSFINGGFGGFSSAAGAHGGFGGGGATHGNSGGGGGAGGYSGGGGQSNQNIGAGGGGGSFSISTMTINGYNTGHGYVTITPNFIITVLPTPTITWANITKILGDADFTITPPTSNSSGIFTYTSSNNSVATVSGTTITLVNTGTSTITATQAAYDNYTSGTATATLTVSVPGLYLFTSHTFTTANTSGPTGPSLSSLLTAYSSASWAQNTSYFNSTNGIQLWTVPATGSYTIRCVGAGLDNGSGYQRGGDGTSTITLTKGEVIRILVGQKPFAYNDNWGGAGGSFVVRGTQTPLIVVGGGGGRGGSDVKASSNAWNNTNGQNGNDSSYNSANNGYYMYGTGGSNGYGGNAGSTYRYSGTGGGMYGDGTNGDNGTLGAGGKSFTNGGNGGGYGGFGGGGGAGGGGGGGGGGGYSGGGNGGLDVNGYWSSGGGGGSYSSTGFSSFSANNNTNGFVTITANFTITVPPPSLYTFTGHTFTNASATGRTGPTLSAARTAYSGVSWAQDTTNNYLNMTTQGIQLWTVPQTGSYTFRAIGAGSEFANSNGGQGADITTTTTLTKGDVIKILVGQKGGGGGATYAVKYDGTPIIVAGGGGAGYNSTTFINAIPLSNATTNNAGNNSFFYE